MPQSLCTKLAEYHVESVVILSLPSLANVMGFSSQFAKSLHLGKKPLMTILIIVLIELHLHL